MSNKQSSGGGLYAALGDETVPKTESSTKTSSAAASKSVPMFIPAARRRPPAAPFAQSTRPPPKPAKAAAPKPKMIAAAAVAALTSVASRDSEKRGMVAAAERDASTALISNSSPMASASNAAAAPVDEYDPSRPNEFAFWESVLRKQRRQAKERLISQSMRRSRRDDASETHNSDRQDAESDCEDDASHRFGLGSRHQQENSPASPQKQPNTEQMDLSADEIYLRRLQKSGIAENASPSKSSLPSKQAPSFVSSSTTTVLVLANLVAPGQVDDDLESETVEECSRFGRILRCTVREPASHSSSGNNHDNDEDAVRVFVEFANQESAKSAQSELNGRFFAGRKVTAKLLSSSQWPS